jgi:oxygen-independent coproporphyrinogen III oxidase
MPGIYLHIPYCIKKCFYCDFYSVETLNTIKYFVDAICKEIEIFSRNENVSNLKFDSVFFGGGTPSLLTASQLSKIINKLHEHFDIDNDAEWTLESNPETLKKQLLIDYQTLGINRLSIGIQSFNDDELKFLQRIHTSKQSEYAIKEARNAGFENLNLDIIFSIPGQNNKKINITLNKIMEFDPEHISAYSLMYEKGTPLYEAYRRKEIEKVDDDKDAELYEIISRYLIDNGYEHYEVSNFAKRGIFSVHNLNYWNSGEYIAFGPSGHGFLNGTRYWNVSSLVIYMQYIADMKLPRKGKENLTSENKFNEMVMLGLRSKGLYFDKFINEFNFDINKKARKTFNNWLSLGLCEYNEEFIKLNYKGYSICNNLINQLINSLDFDSR